MDESETRMHLWLKFSLSQCLLQRGYRVHSLAQTALDTHRLSHLSACLETRRSLHKLGRKSCAKTFKEGNERPTTSSESFQAASPRQRWSARAGAPGHCRCAARVMSGWGAGGWGSGPGTASSPGPCQFVSEDGFPIPFQSSSN